MIEIILFLILLLVIWVLIFKFMKSVFILRAIFKIASIVLIVVFMVSLIGAYYVAKDADDFRIHFASSTNLFILHKDNKFLSAIELRNSSSTQIQEKFKILDNKTMHELEYNYSTGRMDFINEHYYKVFLINTQTIENRPEFQISDNIANFNKSEVLEILLSDDPKKTVADIVSSHQGGNSQDIINGLSASNEDIKGYLFSDHLNYLFSPKNIDKFLSELKDQNIQVYEDTIMFKVIRLLPKFLIKDVINSNSLNNTISSKILNDTSLL